MGTLSAPVLSGDALAAVRHRGSHLQIIAAAGSGKTEVVSQRVADLLADGVAPEGIVAFTFTQRAAEELKRRIEVRVEGRQGRSALDRLGGLFVGTIHAYCFRFLQHRVPRYETYDVLDDNQLTAFLAREATRLKIKDLDRSGRLFASIGAFLRGADVVENELLDPDSMPDPFRRVLRDYLATLDRYRLLTYGQQVVRAVRELERPELAAAVHGELRHLIVDEYQDVNPAQERLVELLTGPDVELCVVGDDDQAIYQWRGSDVSNIIEFRDRYPNVASFEITTNRRSRPQIVEEANRFATTIPGRLAKQMEPFRVAADETPQVVAWYAESELAEAGYIAEAILNLNDQDVAFGDIAILVRGRAAYPRLVEQLRTFDIPVQPGGRTGLFEQPEARVLGRTFAWFTGVDWGDGFGPRNLVQEQDLLDEYERTFSLSSVQRGHVRSLLHEWRAAAPKENRTANLVGELYELLAELDIRSLDLSNPHQLNRVGTLARFSSLLADYESVRRRSRSDAEVQGEQVGGQDRGSWYYKNLAIHIVNYAHGAYEGFDGEADYVLDAVDLTTVHRAKDLEWPVVFVPSMTKKRFPSSKTGSLQDWLVPRDRFAAARYEGSDADERRLFYVAMTRARDWLSVSRHEKVTTQRTAASPYYEALANLEVSPDALRPALIDKTNADEESIALTYSELAAFLECGMAFRLRDRIGFQPRLAPELGYGKAVHHLMRVVAERTRESGSVPSADEIDRILDASFFLPAANKVAHRNLKESARRLVTTYTQKHEDDLHRVWETERPFELHLDGVTVTGRADVILDTEGGVPTALAIVDYKTSTDGSALDHALQLQVYANAGRREGLDVRGAYVHDLKASDRDVIDISPDAVNVAESTVVEAAARLRNRDFTPRPGPRCRGCEVRTVCAASTTR
ncbi:MAG: ATP-dependent helicase [Actinobacteria bacterium]|nr:ATP-dependent helicase [Actinomycetota bacterium]